MFKNLDNYLRDIDHYLAVKDGADEILDEIKSHILEKAEAESGAVTEESVAKAVSAYGPPQEVAARYMEGQVLIPATYKKHLFLYAGFFFAYHLAIIILSVMTHSSAIGFPWFVPKMSFFQAICFIPTALIYNLGLAGIILYVVYRKKGNARLPWPKIFRLGKPVKSMSAPKIIGLIWVLPLFFAALYAYLRFGTVFFYSVNSGAPKSLLTPDSARFFSFLFVAMLGCEAAAYVLRFFIRSWWLGLIKNSIVLFLLFLVWNPPVKAEFVEIPGVDLKTFGTIFVLVLTVLCVYAVVACLIHVGQSAITAKSDRPFVKKDI